MFSCHMAIHLKIATQFCNYQLKGFQLTVPYFLPSLTYYRAFAFLVMSSNILYNVNFRHFSFSCTGVHVFIHPLLHSYLKANSKCSNALFKTSEVLKSGQYLHEMVVCSVNTPETIYLCQHTCEVVSISPKLHKTFWTLRHVHEASYSQRE